MYTASEAPFRATLQYQSANTFRLFALRQVAGTYYLAANSTLTDVTINANTWYHVVWSYNSTGRKLSTFLNGTAIDTDVAMSTSGSSVNDSSTVIGSFRSTSGPFFDGDLDQIRFFTSTLTQSQVTTLARGAGSAYNGTENSVTYDAGAFGKAAVFNGSSSGINLPSILPANSTASSTATCWFNTSYSGANMGTIFSAWNGNSSAPGYGLWTEGNANFLRMASYYLFGNVVGTDGTTNVSDGAWHFVAVVFTNNGSSSSLKCYLDGNSTPEISITGTAAATVDNWTTDSSLGYQIAGGNIRYFNGKIDQVRIFNTALSASNIATLARGIGTSYNGGETNITWQNGRFNEAALFNGSSSKIELPNSNLGITDASNFSISYWFYTFSATQSNQSAIWTNGNNAGARFGSGINSSSQGGNTSVYFGVGTSAFTYINSGTSAFAANTWVHVVCIKSSTTGISLYVDNVLKATNTAATGPASTTASGKNTLGMYNTSSDSLFFNGFIDQVRLFNTAISESQVADLYNEHYQTKFIDGTDTALLFTRGTGSITFSGTSPIPPQGAIRTNTSFSEDGSASAIEHYNGTEWKQFDAIKYCTTNTLNFPGGAGCIASYNFNNNVNDIGNTYNGTNSGVTFTSSGKFGAAAIFNTDYITTPSVIPTNNFSFSFWVNMASFPGSATNQVVFVQNESNNRWYIAVYESGKIQAWNGSGTFTTSSSVINLNQWHNVVYTASSSTGKKIYVDGTEVLSDADTNNNTGTATGNLFIGFGKWYANSLYLDGKLDQTRIFNTALTPTQISSLYNNEIACS